jgi:predicted phosphodiesterase
MKIMVFGDLHGENKWENHVKKIDQYDYVVFMGDYVDSFTHLDVELIENLDNLIKLKEKHQNKVILLLGNHDNQYLYSDFPETRCSGFRQHIYLKLKSRYKNYFDFFNAAFQTENILFTHAGLLKAHYDKLNAINKNDNQRYDSYLNKMFFEKPRAMFSVSALRGGDDMHGGIFWADWRELVMEKECLPINQVVGHSANYGGEFISQNGKFIFNADSILKNQSFYEINKNANNDWVIETKNLSV